MASWAALWTGIFFNGRFEVGLEWENERKNPCFSSIKISVASNKIIRINNNNIIKIYRVKKQQQQQKKKNLIRKVEKIRKYHTMMNIIHFDIFYSSMSG